MSVKRDALLRSGQVLIGKWTSERVVVERLLGTGANGQVYLVQFCGRSAAMKVSVDAGDIALEWGILQRLADSGLFPQPLVADDAVASQPLYFYVMEWVPGRSLADVLARLDPAELLDVLVQVVSGLERLHRMGYAFCDVKPENVLVDGGVRPKVRMIDVGGVTPFGRSARQFTPLYDRAFWQMGTRQSCAAYDIAAVGLLVLCALQRTSQATVQQLAAANRQAWLRRALSQVHPLALRRLLSDMVDGRLDTAAAVLAAARGLKLAGTRGAGSAAQTAAAPPNGGPSGTRAGATPGTSAATVGSPARAAVASGVRMDWTERVMWVSLVAAFSAACYAGATVLGWV